MTLLLCVRRAWPGGARSGTSAGILKQEVPCVERAVELHQPPALPQTAKVQCGEPELVQQTGHGRLRVGVVARVEDHLTAFLVLRVRGDERGEQAVERLHDPRPG